MCILEQCAIRLLFGFLLFHRRFSINLSYQVVENLSQTQIVKRAATRTGFSAHTGFFSVNLDQQLVMFPNSLYYYFYFISEHTN